MKLFFNRVPRLLFFFLLIGSLPKLAAQDAQLQETTPSFTLRTAARTSAGVFKDSVLVRTLWNNKPYDAGTYPLANVWDGKDDLGNLLPDGPYTISVLANNVTYTWEGIIGNTSDQYTGSSVHHPGETILGMAIEGRTAYFTVGYNEGRPGHLKFDLSTPGSKSAVLGTEGQVLRHVCSDGLVVYWTGANDGGDTFFVVGTNVANDAQTTFTSGTRFQTAPNKTVYTNALNVGPTPTTGLAVQRTGTYLFCSHASTNQIRVFNKTTGALVQTITSIVNPREMVVADNALWVISGAQTVAKYTINGNGTISGPVLTLGGLAYPMALALAPTGELAIMDSGNRQQVRFFNPATGQELTPLGQLGGYATSPTVTSKKFFFNDTKIFREDNYGASHGYLCYQPDGSLWVGDYGNWRSLLFSKNKDHLKTLQWMGYSYSVQADKNNTSRIFCNYLEFLRNYNKPLLPANDSWTLTNNWAYGVTATRDDQYFRLFNVMTLANNRTYALNGASGNRLEVVELPPSGNLRFTGIQMPSKTYALFPDGSRWISGANDINQPLLLTRQPLLGFDVRNNPVWGAGTSLVSGLTVGNLDPLTAGGGSDVFAQTSTGVLVTYSRDRYIAYANRGNGFHLGGITNNRWRFKTSPSTYPLYMGEFPDDGAYDIGNNVNNSGNYVQALDRNIIYGYNGEFWKDSQTNKYNHFWDNGLMVGQFGTTGPEAKAVGDATSQMAGNANRGTLVKVGADYYLYHCDEGYHAGIHSWKISNLNTIVEQRVGITKQGVTTPTRDYVDLMTDVPFRDTLRTNVGRWSRSSGETNRGAYDRWSITTSRTTYKQEDRDLYIEFRPATDNQAQWVRCDLGSNNNAKWRVSGEVAYPEAAEPNSNFLEILDASDKVLARISRPEAYPNTIFYANNTVITQGPTNTLAPTFRKLQPFTISSDGTSLTVTYGPYAPVTVGVLQAGASLATPKTLRVYFQSTQRAGHVIDIAKLKFYKQ